ncbi:MAG: hypothetical protein RIR62_1484 [Pseudomonadota bacterium]
MARGVPPISRATALLVEEVPRSRLTSICDVGANPVVVPPYAGLLKAGACRVTGFEPNRDAFARLMETKGANESYHNVAVGDGGEVDYHLYTVSSLSSVFPPHMAGLRAIGASRWGRVEAVEKMKTVTLDKLKGLEPFDCLKIDIQGGELAVFRNARKAMAECICVIVEARYLQIYENEPMLGGIDAELRAQGFMLHRFIWNKAKPMPSSQGGRLLRGRHNDQLVDGDAVYLRHPGLIAGWSDDQLAHGAILGSTLFESHSFVLYCLDELVRRGRIGASLPARYVDRLPAELRVEGDKTRVSERVLRRQKARADRAAADGMPEAPDRAAE